MDASIGGVGRRIWRLFSLRFAALEESTRILRRRAKQKIYPGAPSIKLMFFGGLVILLIPLLLSYVFNVPWLHSTDNECTKSELGCGLSIHVVGTGLVAVLVYSLFFLRRGAHAAAKWRADMKQTPLNFFTWLGPVSGGLTGLAATSSTTGDIHSEEFDRSRAHPRRRRSPLVKSIVGRDELVNEIADDLDDDAGPQLIVADTAAGKTMILVKLADCLARRGQVPIAISLQAKGEVNFEHLAREAFLDASRQFDHEEAVKHWRWLNRRHLVTVLADDLEKAKAKPDEVAQALDRAAREGLRLVAASRPYGIPAEYRRGRIDLEPLDEGVVRDNLLRSMQETRKSGTNDGARATFVEQLARSADLPARPYLFQVARVLADSGELEPLYQQWCRSEEHAREDRATPLTLLGAYREAMVATRLRPDILLSPEGRASALEDLEAVAFARIQGTRELSTITAKLHKLGITDVDVDSTVRHAREFSLVTSDRAGTVRFAHGMTLSYLASRFLVRTADPGFWHTLADQNWSPLRAMALVMASAEVNRPELIQSTCRHVLEHASSDRPAGSQGGVYGRLGELTTAADLACRLRSIDGTRLDSIAPELIEQARGELIRGGPVGREHLGLVEALAKLHTPSAYELLWDYATANVDCLKLAVDYLVRRAALKALVQAKVSALDTCIPRIERALARADEFSQTLDEPEPDDRHELFDDLRAVAWILPSLHTMASLGSFRRQKERLKVFQRKLLAYAGLSEDGNMLTVQRGIEAAIAQGLKLDAIQNPNCPIDPLAIAMLAHGKERARFWFSRILLLQALTARCESNPQLARDVIAAAALDDEHPFVRRTAKLCLRALRAKQVTAKAERAPRKVVRKAASLYKRTVFMKEPEAWFFDDLTELVGRAPRRTATETCQLAGDMALALNLNEYGGEASRHHFGTEARLPACLSSSRDRSAILVYEPPDQKCPFFGFQDHGCLCPYKHDYPAGAIRRELSRAFCRHQRLHARPVPWQPKMRPKDVRQFWASMEDLARF